jgi:hypothetical protein
MKRSKTSRRPRIGAAGWTVRVVAVTGAVALMAVASGTPDGARQALRSTRPVHATLASANGQVTAHDGKFWLGSAPIALHGANVRYPCCSSADYEKLVSWGMNFIRLKFQWSLLEPNPPVKNTGGAWTHSYDLTYLSKFAANVARAQQAGLYTLVNNGGYHGSYFSYPDWLYQAPYNSLGITYPLTPAGSQVAATDFWRDALRQRFMIDEMEAVANALRAQPGVLGYEILNEPYPALLPNSAETTATLLDFQLRAATGIRGADPARVVVFTTRFGYAPGVAEADLSGFTALGNVAFDAHDYFGARWGDGLLNNPAMPDYHERMQPDYNNPLETTQDGSAMTPYIGTTDAQVRWIKKYTDVLTPRGIPLLVGEFGIDGSTNTSAYLYFGTITSALNYTGVAWAVSQWDSPIGIADSSGILRPWGSIVINAAKGIVA